jgi:hypothetical protein
MADRKTKIVNFYESTLASLLASGSGNTTLTAAPTTDGTTVINASSGDSSSHYYLVVDPDNSSNREVILVTESTGTTLTTISRDLEDRHATDPDHQAGTTVRMAVVAEQIADVNDRIDEDEVTNAAHRSNTSNPHSVTFAQLGLLDEDDMATNSATLAPSQQSVKSYVDTQVAAAGGASLGLVIALS